MKNMKNKFLTLGTAVLALVLGLALTACDSLIADKEYAVTFYAEGGSPPIQTQTVTSGDSIGTSNMPSNPSKSGYTFDGWYTSQNGGGERFSGTTKVTADISVYAKWTADATPEGVTYELTWHPDYDNYIYNNSDDFLPSGFTVDAGERITVSFSIKTDTAMTGFYVGIGDWNNGNRYDDSDDAWIAPGWEDSKSVPADGQFHSYTWTLTANAAAPASSNPLVFHFAMDSVSKSKVTVYVKDVIIAKTIGAPSNVSLAESLTWIANNAVEGGVYSVALKSNETIAPKTLSYSGKTVRITLTGGGTERTVGLSSSGSLFTVGSGVTLTLGNNVTLQGRSDNTASLVYVNSGGTLVMNDGAKITGNSTSTLGGGVCGYGTIIMNGGAIHNNATDSQGGGIFIDGNLVMNGGVIGNNTAGSYGGGICSYGSFTMNGGTISGNAETSASAGGGGVMTSGGHFIMTGGSISGNTASWGSGVLIWSGNNVDILGTFLKTGGVIYGSDAEEGLRNAPGYAVEVEGAAYNNSGDLVSNPIPTKRRGATAGVGVTLDSAKDGAAGGWVDGAVTQYTVTYNANGASGTPPSAQTVSAGSSATVAGQGSLTYSGKTFDGWNTSSTGAGTPYGAGDSLTVNADVTLYAQWKSNSALSWEYVGDLPGWNMYYHRASVMNGKIVITCDNMALTSSDGKNWYWNYVIPEENHSFYHQHILFNNKLYSVGGFTYNSADDYWAVDSLVTESSNLSSWTVKTGVTGLTDGVVQHVGLAFNNAMWVIGGSADPLLDDWLVTDAVWKSTDGVNWVKQDAIGLTPRGEAAGVVYNGKIYITGGFIDGAQDELNDVVASPDGITWTTLTTNPGWLDRNGHTLSANSQGMWLVGGNGGDNAEFFNDVWFSSDGVNWTSKGNAPFAPRSGHASVIKDGYLYVIGGATDDWELLGDIWRVYIGGTDMDASSYSIEPATLTITNSASYPIKYLYINSGSNELSSNLAVGGDWRKQFEPGTYSFTVYDTQDRYQSFSITIGTASQTKTIGNSGWTEPIQVIPSYTLTIRNNYGFAISEVYVRKSGTSAWGSNRINAAIAANGSVSLGSFESDTYEIKLVSTKSTGTKIINKNTARPSITLGRSITTYATIYYYPTVDLTANSTVSAPSASGSWSTTNK
ncbi:MAG: InlB B-repeat-containing protein [Treponema sp.]|jgi:uncharacterized repeat protein (TIGR02543 family)|nr:InlB B-repeat-containing protein [Treponema sp.]